MNREILYRGKQINNEKWHYGDLLKFGNKRYINICPRFVDEYIVEEDKIALYSFGNFIEVIPETVGRCTGLVDKNGLTIFEGDIIKHKEMLFTVKYSTEQARFLALLPNGVFNPIAMKDCEVISNIHDNPELIGGTENDGTINKA